MAATTQGLGQGLRVGIVGGSIAGCAAAIELARAGCEVSVFERSRGALVGRGAGIATPRATLRALVERDLLDAGFPFVRFTSVALVGTSPTDDRLGRVPWRPTVDMAAMHWGTLYRALRRRVPDARYHQGGAVTDARMVEGDAIEVRFDDGVRRYFDLVVFADGYQSLGRRLLFPEVEVQYRGYVVWRGVLEERQLADSGPLDGASNRVMYRGLAGSLIAYFVPSLGGSTAPGDRLVNWAAYVAVPAEELPAFLTDRHGRRHAHSLPPGGMRPAEEDRLKALVRAHAPAYYADIVAASRETFAQPIYTVDAPSYRRGRICLLGDAGAVASPLVSSGVFKATTNAIELGAALRAGGDLEAALAAWDEAQTRVGQHFATQSRRAEQACVWETPDLSSLDAAATEAWWNQVVSQPR